MLTPYKAPDNFFAEGYWDNRCILASAGSYLSLGSGCIATPDIAMRILLGNNTIYVPGGKDAVVSCGRSYSFKHWAALGLDPGTTIAEVPQSAQIVGWARTMLGM